MNIAIVGYGLEGQAAYNYYKDKGTITICDVNHVDVPEGTYLQSGPNYLADLSRFDVIVRSPAVKPNALVEASGRDILEKVTSNTNEFIKVSPTRNIIGVTGTKGKGTTSTLITKIIEKLGKRVFLGGNIGLPALDLLKEGIKQEDWVVLELSSYQLIDANISPHIGVCLMIEPEHLDWHADIDEYYNAKTNLFRHQNSDDIAIYYALSEGSRRIASTSKGFKLPYMDKPGAIIKDDNFVIGNEIICSVTDLKLLGKHNWQNVAAAITASWQVERNPLAFKEAITGFSGLPYRLEFRGEKDNVRYYDDSFSSAPPAALAAIEAIPGKKVLILGGYERNLPLEDFANGIKQNLDNIRQLLLIGQSAQRLARVLDSVGVKLYTVSEDKIMEEIVNKARQFTKPGDAVVLSPGFASFDMFTNFIDRGNKFNQAVDKL